MSDDGQLEAGDRDTKSHGVPVTPLVKGRAIPILPRILIGSVLVGVIIFVVAVQLGGRQSPDPVVAIAPGAPAPPHRRRSRVRRSSGRGSRRVPLRRATGRPSRTD